MYNVTAKYKQYIKKSSTEYDWYGSILFSDSTSISFSREEIDQNKSRIIKQCVTGENLEIGNVYSAELRLTLRDSDTWKVSDRTYDFQDAMVIIFFQLKFPDGTSEDVPCGEFYVDEAERTYHTVTLVAHDATSKFTKKLSAKYTGSFTPYNAISAVCSACGVTLGMTQAQVEALPNGTRDDLKMDVYKKGTSYRDILGNICTIVGSNAFIGRTGRLELVKYGETSVRALTAGERYNTSYVDYVGCYRVIYVVNKKGEVDEYGDSTSHYVTRTLAMNVGKNTLLNKYSEANRDTIIGNILTYLRNVVYSPCNVTMPADPSIDTADLISVIGGEITGTYVKTIDTSVEDKTYYRLSQGTYIEVTPVGDENPAQQGWYEVGAGVLCTKIEIPLFGQMKITSQAGSYELEIDPYATEKEQQQQQDNGDNEDRWDQQEETNQENEDRWDQQEETNEEVGDALDTITGDMQQLSAKMAVNYIFPYSISTSAISDGGNAYVLRFRFKCDRDGDTVAFYAQVSFTVETTVSNNAYNDCVLTVTYEMDGTTIATSQHSYGDGYAILTLNGIMANPTAGDHTFDVRFAVSGGGIS